VIRWVNALGVVLAFGSGVAAFAASRSDLDRSERSAFALPHSQGVDVETLPDGSRAVTDRSGRLVRIEDYQRIASASTISDTLLLEFVSPNRIAAFTQYSQKNELFGHRFAHKPRIDALKDMERLLALEPDLLVVSTLSSETRLQRLRDAGLNVFVLGEMRGQESFLHNARSLAVLLGRPKLGELYARSFARRMRSIAKDLPPERRKTAMQLTFYGKKIYSSGRETSYHDVLTAAGLVDVGAQQFDGWPALSAEQVLSLNPQTIVTRDGMGSAICSNTALESLRACANSRAGIVELPDALINDPGPMMLPSAELIHAQVYGDEPQP
jgi:iron complex transport system substrate-binding protein